MGAVGRSGRSDVTSSDGAPSGKVGGQDPVHVRAFFQVAFRAQHAELNSALGTTADPHADRHRPLPGRSRSRLAVGALEQRLFAVGGECYVVQAVAHAFQSRDRPVPSPRRAGFYIRLVGMPLYARMEPTAAAELNVLVAR